MAFDEKELLERLSEKSETADDLMALSKFQVEYKFRKQRYYFFLMTLLLIFYAFAGILFYKFYQGKSTFSLTIDTSHFEERILNLESKTNSLYFDILSNASSTSYASSSINSLDKRMNSIEEAINLNPEKALTATLIREEQNNIQEDINELKQSVVKLNDRYDTLLISVIIVPLISLLLSFSPMLFRKYLFKDSSEN